MAANDIIIVGAGMAGLLAANMLARHKPIVIEAQPALPNNHSAVLRFGSERVGEVLGIPFKKVQMIKGSIPWLNPVADSLAYAAKCGGVYRSDRSITSGVTVGDRWIAPPDLIERMAKDLIIDFGHEVSWMDGPMISTIPMPALMKALDYPDTPDFKYVGGANIRATVMHCDAYVSLYIPDPSVGYNRVSITGDEIIIEYAFPTGGSRDGFNSDMMDNRDKARSEAGLAALALGLNPASLMDVTVTPQRYAKIQPIDDGARKRFMAWATDQHNVFSLGRFATWRPGLLLDDLVHDIRQIEKWINDRYAMRFAR